MSRSSHASTPLPRTFEEASDWFVRFRLGDVGAKEREAFNDWLCRSPDHIRAYLQIAQTYVDLPALGKTTFDIKALVARARSDDNVIHLGETASAPLGHRASGRASRRRWQRPTFALAAGIALATLGILGYISVDAYRTPTYTTATGEQRSIALPDGSMVALNSKSRVRVRLSDQERKIDLLAGQAFFQVAKDQHRPFVVHSGDTVIRAVGTEFDVYRRKNGTTVTVIEGRVAIASSGAGASAAAQAVAETPSIRPPGGRKPSRSEGEVYVSAGQQLILAPGSAMEPHKAESAAAIAWTQRRLVFDGTSLPEAVEEFNRYNTRPLILQAEELDKLRISGIYSTADPVTLLRFLEVEFGLTVRQEPDRIVISRE